MLGDIDGHDSLMRGGWSPYKARKGHGSNNMPAITGYSLLPACAANAMQRAEGFVL